MTKRDGLIDGLTQTSELGIRHVAPILVVLHRPDVVLDVGLDGLHDLLGEPLQAFGLLRILVGAREERVGEDLAIVGHRPDAGDGLTAIAVDRAAELQLVGGSDARALVGVDVEAELGHRRAVGVVVATGPDDTCRHTVSQSRLVGARLGSRRARLGLGGGRRGIGVAHVSNRKQRHRKSKDFN